MKDEQKSTKPELDPDQLNTKSTSEKKDVTLPKEKSTSMFEVPQDEGYSWYVVLACFITNVLMVGLLLRTIGILFLAITRYYAVPTTTAVWIPATLSGVGMVSGAGSGLLSDKIGTRPVVLAGGAIGASGFIISSFVTKIEYLYLTLGVMPGLAFGSSYVPTVSHVSKYFTKRRGLATGLGMAGSGIGAFVSAPLTTYLLEEYSLNGTLFILGGVILNMLVVGMLLRPTEFYERKRKPHVAGLKSMDRTENRGFEQDVVSDYKKSCNEQTLHGLQQSRQLKGSDVNQENVIIMDKKRNKLVAIICDKGFMIYMGVTSFIIIGYYNCATIVLPAWSEENKLSSNEIALVMSIFGGCDAVGRVLFSALNDRQFIPTAVLFSLAMLGAGVMNFMVTFFGHSFNTLASFCAVFGFCVGCFPPLQAILIIQIVGLDRLQSAFGILFMMGLPQIFIQQAAAQAYELSGSWMPSLAFCAASFLMGSLGLLLLHFYLVRREKSKVLEDSEIAVIFSTRL